MEEKMKIKNIASPETRQRLDDLGKAASTFMSQELNGHEVPVFLSGNELETAWECLFATIGATTAKQYYMYMGTWKRGHAFKHAETREYVYVKGPHLV